MGGAGRPFTATAVVSLRDSSPWGSVTLSPKVSVASRVSAGAVKVGETALALLRVTGCVTAFAGGVGNCAQAQVRV